MYPLFYYLLIKVRGGWSTVESNYWLMDTTCIASGLILIVVISADLDKLKGDFSVFPMFTDPIHATEGIKLY